MPYIDFNHPLPPYLIAFIWGHQSVAQNDFTRKIKHFDTFTKIA